MMAVETEGLGYRSQSLRDWDCDENDLVFQAIHWYAADERLTNVDDESPSTATVQPAYTIKVFGSDLKGRTVSCTIKGFTPYFYVRVPDTWGEFELTSVQRWIKNTLASRLGQTLASQVLQARYIQRKDFWGFTNFRKFKFLRLSFTTLRCFKAVQRILEDKVQITNIPGVRRMKLYECNIDPYIRFMHIRDILPCGWIRISAGSYEPNQQTDMESTCQLDMECDWQCVDAYECEQSSPFLIASFDIECMSNTGDFPVPRKDYRKLAYELVQKYQKEIIAGKASDYNFAQVLMDSVMYAVGCCETGPSCITVHKVKEIADAQQVRIELAKRVDDLMRILKDGFKKIQMRQAGMNYEKVAALLNADLMKMNCLPALVGDEIIQIGTTFHRYGERECCFRHILTLGSCDSNIPDTVVESCQSEAELLLKWRDLIRSTNPDILTGYNIFGFDFSYIYNRTVELQCNEEFMLIGKFRYRPCKFVTKRLSSSALGDNILEYIDIEGRTLIDLMKVIQRDHKLDSYKLDHVAHTFMGMNKHDVSPQDIFRLQKGSATDRRIIAEYCVQDCALCNHLVMKLEVLANNVGMANVCLVPLSYIFLRGQGIKIYSLVLKQCKEDGFLIPSMVKSNTTVFRSKEPIPVDFIDDIVASFKKNTRVDKVRIWKDELSSTVVDGLVKTNVYCVALHRCHPEEIIKQLKRVLSSAQWMMQSEGSDFRTAIENFQKTILRQCTKLEDVYAFEDLDEEPEDESSGYEGAIVLEPKHGIYIDAPVSVLDYASLYPSSMISENLSHDCIVLDPAYDNISGYEYVDVGYDLYEGTGDTRKKVGEKVCRFVQLPNGEKGVLPRILMKLLKARKTTRKKADLKKIVFKNGSQEIGFYANLANYIILASGEKKVIEPNDVLSVEDLYSTFHKAVLDGLQLAYKITANSLYGQMGARTSPLYLKDIAACTTAVGRKMILMAKAFLEDEYKHGARIIYGDSVTGDTPITVMYNGQLHVIPMQELSNLVGTLEGTWGYAHDGKEACEVFDDGVMVWTDSGWTRIQRIIRHTLAPSKKIFGVLTPSGYVEVTEDHSLLTLTREPITPRELQKGSRILHSVIQIPYEGFYDASSSVCSESTAYSIGCEMAVDSTTASASTEMLHSILNAPMEIRSAFTRGLLDADTPIIVYSSIYASLVYNIVTSTARHVTIAQDASKAFVITFKLPTTDHAAIQALENIPQDCVGQYVYDLTTDNHHFAAGVGSIIVHNTDSVFVSFDNKDAETGQMLCGPSAVKNSIEHAHAASQQFKKYLKPPHDLEYDKTFYPFILLSKKRYVGNLYEDDENKYCQKSMGIVLKRRDNAPIVKRVYGGIIDIILNKNNIPESVSFLKSCLQELVDGKYPLEELVITKSLRAEYKDPDRIAHKVLAERMAERDPGNKPQANDRIPYVYVYNKRNSNSKEKVLQGERIETPDFIRKSKLVPDYEFYITNQIMKPVLQLYALAATEITNKPSHYFENYMTDLKRKHPGLSPVKYREKMDDFKEQEVKKVLFDPILMQVFNARNNNQSITKFFKQIVS